MASRRHLRLRHCLQGHEVKKKKVLLERPSAAGCSRSERITKAQCKVLVDILQIVDVS